MRVVFSWSVARKPSRIVPCSSQLLSLSLTLPLSLFHLGKAPTGSSSQQEVHTRGFFAWDPGRHPLCLPPRVPSAFLAALLL